MGARQINIGIIDAHHFIRLGVRAALGGHPSAAKFDLLVEAESVGEFLARDSSGKCSVVLFDPVGSVNAVRRDVESLVRHGMKVLIFSAGNNTVALRQVLAAGALGLVRKSDATAVLVQAIEEAAAGRPFYNRQAQNDAVGEHSFKRALLSRREQETLRLYASGLGQGQVASRMGIAASTVKENIDRIRKIYNDMDRPAPTKLDLYARAVEDGLLEPWLPRT